MSPFSAPMSRLTPHSAAHRISELNRFLYLRISGVSCVRSWAPAPPIPLGVTFTEGPEVGVAAAAAAAAASGPPRLRRAPEGLAPLVGEAPGPPASALKPKDRKDFCFS